MGSEAEEYNRFEKKVKRTIYLDNLSPNVTDAVIKTAFEQYGNVTSIQFIPNYAEPFLNSKCALVEFESEKQAEAILDMLSSYPFMMTGMPRPVRALPAQAEMFDDRPAKPGRKIEVHWVAPTHPDFEVAQKMKNMARRHHEEQSDLYKRQLEEEEKLSKQQSEALKAHYQKYEMVDSLKYDGSIDHLARRYNIKMTEDYGS